MNTRVEKIDPYLNVNDIFQSMKYYIDVLGFDRYIELPNLGIVQHDGHQIHFIPRKDEIFIQWVWIGRDSVENLFEKLQDNGSKISQEPTNYSLAYQMIIEDLDGHLLI